MGCSGGGGPGFNNAHSPRTNTSAPRITNSTPLRVPGRGGTGTGGVSGFVAICRVTPGAAATVSSLGRITGSDEVVPGRSSTTTGGGAADAGTGSATRAGWSPRAAPGDPTAAATALFDRSAVSSSGRADPSWIRVTCRLKNADASSLVGTRSRRRWIASTTWAVVRYRSAGAGASRRSSTGTASDRTFLTLLIRGPGSNAATSCMAAMSVLAAIIRAPTRDS